MRKITKCLKYLTKLGIASFLILLSLPSMVMASEPSLLDATYPSSDISWYDASAIEFTLSKPEQLIGLAQLVNEGTADFYGKTVRLQNDIDLGANPWIPISHLEDNIINGQYFMGTFDGMGHRVFNMRISETVQTPELSAWGLFGFSDAIIKNVHVEGSISLVGNGGNYIGGIAGMVGGSIENSTSSVDISIYGYVNTSSIGGIVGDLQGGGKVLRSVFNGSIEIMSTFNGNPYVGGIAGTVEGSSILESINQGDISVVSGYGYVGGIVGQIYTDKTASSASIDSSYNMANVTMNMVSGSSFNNSAGGIAGGISAFLGNASITNSFTLGTLSNHVSIKNIGGIVGHATNDDGVTSGSNNYFIETFGANDTFGMSKTLEEMSGQGFVDLLNTNNANMFILGNSGLPILAYQGFELTVVNGTGSGIYPDQMSVVISADTIKDGEWFLGWKSSNGGVFGNKNSLNTTFTMPAANTTVTATFEVIPLGNYNSVNVALGNIPSDLTLYTKDTVDLLQNLVNSIDYTLNVTQQTKIEKYAIDIEQAIRDLIYLDADYSAVDNALMFIPADMTPYTVDSAQILDDAVNAIIRGKNITEQGLVDGYASAIENAISDLVYIDADYTAVDGALMFVPADMTLYTVDSAKVLDDAINAIIQGKDITEQGLVNGYALAIEQAIHDLVYLDGDYSAVDAALKFIPADMTLYTADSEKVLDDAVNAIIRGKNITEQGLIDGYAFAIEQAMEELVYIDADYAAVDEALMSMPMNMALYTVDSAKVLDDAVNAIIRGKDITEQGLVDGYASAIEKAISELVYLDADYTAVDDALMLVPADMTLYTADSANKLDDAVNAIIRGKDITEQGLVNGYALAIEQAIHDLVYLDGDYSAVDDALMLIPADMTLYTTDSANKLDDAVNAIIRGKNITEQGLVNGYASAIEKAIHDLMYLDGDYSAVDDALMLIPADMTLYTADSANKLDDAVNAIIRGKNITEQTLVDDYAKDILNAINKLEKNLVVETLTQPEAQIQSPNTGDQTNIPFLIIALVSSSAIFAFLQIKRRTKKI